MRLVYEVRLPPGSEDSGAEDRQRGGHEGKREMEGKMERHGEGERCRAEPER